MLGHGGRGNGVQVGAVPKTGPNLLSNSAPVAAKSQVLSMLGITLIYATCFIAIKRVWLSPHPSSSVGLEL